VCWDALDGSSLFELFQDQNLSESYAAAARVLMIFWYLSVGCRLAIMFCAHLDPRSALSGWLVTAPLSLSPEPTVDRSLQAMRLRSVVVIVMAAAEFYALGLRVTLWIRGNLSATQQEMMIKNFLFLVAFASAYSTFSLTATRSWNARKIFCITKPSRGTQVQMLRWSFALSYVVIGAMMSSYLAHVTGNNRWVVNVGSDIVLVVVFLIAFRAVTKRVSLITQLFCVYIVNSALLREELGSISREIRGGSRGGAVH
jgi:hypothetical protein